MNTGSMFTTRKKWLSVALGVGLAVASLGAPSVSAQTGQGTGQQGTQSTMSSDRQAYNEFLEQTAREWSEAGYNSAEHMRVVLGGEWYADMRARFGTGGTGQGAMAADQEAYNNAVEQTGTAFGGAFGEGQIEDDEANGSVITGNDSQGSENEDNDQADDGDEDADEADGDDEDADEADGSDSDESEDE